MKTITILSILLAPTTVLGLLDAKIKSKGKRYYGAIGDPNTLSNTNVQNILRTEFGQITPENSMKWDSTEPSQGNFQFGNSDQLVNFATSNGKLVRGHTLVWHSQLPSWVNNINNAQTLTAVLENHVRTLVTRWRGRIYAWDVVNEIFEENGSFRQSVFYRLLGENFVDIAFRAARAADPAAKLYINDYNLDGPGGKVDAVINLVTRAKARGVPIDGIGTQAHLILGQVGGVQTQLQRLANAAGGVDVAITELDIRIAKPVDSSKLNQQGTDYATVTRACLAVSRCVGITVWGVSDRNSWVDSVFPTYDSPLLWDDNFAKKPAYNGADTALN